MRITKVTTKAGDGGETRLADGTKVSKSVIRIQCLGLVDELNSFLGHAKIVSNDDEMTENILAIQNQLLDMGGEISSPATELNLITDNTIEYLERLIKMYNADLPPLKEFVIPGDSEFSARLHIARSVCRRVETNLVKLQDEEDIKPLWIKYMNRLSDLLFIISRYHLMQSSLSEKQWDRIKK